MRTINMYVEGKSDLIFLCQLLSKFYDWDIRLDLKKWEGTFHNPKILSINIRTISTKEAEGGIDSKKIRDLITEIRTVNEPKGIESVLFIDADTDAHIHPKGGFVAREEYLKKFQETAKFRYFIIPTHADDGNLESVLDEIICEKGKDFYTCLTIYVNGLLELKDDSRPKYIVKNPKLNKEKISWYIYMMEGGDRACASGLQNSELWNFDSEKLKPLKTFFDSLNCNT